MTHNLLQFLTIILTGLHEGYAIYASTQHELLE